MSASCLCQTDYGKFRTDKIYEWKELKQGNPWAPVVADFETWAVNIDQEIQKDPYKYNRTAIRTVDCARPSSKTSSMTSCLYYNEKKSSVEFELIPKPGEAKCTECEPHEPEKGSESGPYYGGDVPGDQWDNAPTMWVPKQMNENCPESCLDTEGGTVDEEHKESTTLWKEPHINDHYEKVKTTYKAKILTSWKFGLEHECCPENPYLPRVETIPLREPREKAGPEVELPFGLFWGEQNYLIEYTKKHVCL